MGKRIRLIIPRLGDPTKNALKTWYREYQQRQDLPAGYTRPAKSSQAQKEQPVEHYFELRQCVAAMVKSPGLPCRSLLSA
jgi:hypothetical protein